MYKHFFLLLFAFVSFGLNAQTEGDNHPIERAAARCTENAVSTSDMINCEYEAMTKWDAELNKNYKQLMAALDTDGKAVLKESQRQWMVYRDKEFLLISQVYGMDGGTMWLPVIAGLKKDMVKKRALELAGYFEAIGN